MNEIEVKRSDAEHKDKNRGYKDPQNTLDHESSILWDHNDLRPIWGEAKIHRGSDLGQVEGRAIYRAEYTTE